MLLCVYLCAFIFFCFKQKTAYEMRISDWSSDVCSSDLAIRRSHDTATASILRTHSQCQNEGKSLTPARTPNLVSSSSGTVEFAHPHAVRRSQADRKSVV